MTKHRLINDNSENMKELKNNSIQLIVTSPPYPMISMWDVCFDDWVNQDTKLQGDSFKSTFEKYHMCLDRVWQECDRVLQDGCFACINIGDAVRTVEDNFQLYSNHTRITEWFINHNYFVLPPIIWHKPTNSPNKFMGSGMYPAGAYVTLEHEYILIFRKGGKRVFTEEEKLKRQQSAYFYEERNEWFSDIWNIRGTSQKLLNGQSNRERNASYPFEIPYRLISMYSIQNDTILDPFCGLGTTNQASLVLCRNSIGYDIDNKIINTAKSELLNYQLRGYCIIIDRLDKHKEYAKDDTSLNYHNEFYDFAVKTKQEVKIQYPLPFMIKKLNDCVVCEYS